MASIYEHQTDTSNLPIGPCGPLIQSFTDMMASLSTALDLGAKTVVVVVVAAGLARVV